jgi:hypothetical protein
LATIISLFDYTGNWPLPWKEAGHKVVQVDIKHGHDILKINERWLKDLGPVYGVLAAPPCTDFSVSGAQYWPAKDMDGRTALSLKLVKKTLWIVKRLQPNLSFWAMENPVGRLNKLVPALIHYGPWYFQPHWYGDPYTKKTGLWGVFNRNLPRTDVDPIKACAQGSWLQTLGGKSERTKELRSTTPMGFARAFYEANKPRGVLD